MQKDGNDIQAQGYTEILKDTLTCMNILDSRSSDDEIFSEKVKAVRNAFDKIKEEKYVENFMDFVWQATGEVSQGMFEIASALYCVTLDEWFYSWQIDILLRREMKNNGNFYLLLQLKRQQEICYFRLNRKQVFIDEWNANQYFRKEMQKLLQMNFRKIPVSERQQDFIVIVTTQLLGVHHAPTRMTLEFCRIFEKNLKTKVLLVCALESICAENINKLGIKQIFSVNYVDANGFFTISYKDCTIKCYQLFLNEENQKEQQDLIQMIYEKKPLFVWQFAGIPSFGSAMQQFTSYYYMQMTQGYPAVSADLVINYFQDTRKHHPDAYRMLQDKGVPVADMFFTFTRNSSKGLLSRRQFQIPEDGFCLGVAGNRLAVECTDEFLRILARVLKKEANIYLVFIGEADQSLIGHIQKKINLEERCFFLGYQSDPEEALALIDLYVDLPHQGGGYMGISAISEGKPVICLKGGDVSAKVGEEFCFDSLDEYENEILKYKNDVGYYKMKSEAARNRAESIIVNDEEMADLISKTIKVGLQEVMV